MSSERGKIRCLLSHFEYESSSEYVASGEKSQSLPRNEDDVKPML